MKIRTGFVSNSSSSSYIIAIAKIDDLDLIINKTRNFKKVYELEIIELNTESDNDIRDGNLLTIESFVGDSISINIDDLDQSEPNYFLAYHFNGDEGDGFFIEPQDDMDILDIECPYIDYDIGDDFFSDQEQSIMNIFHGDGLSNLQLSFGAGRNG